MTETVERFEWEDRTPKEGELVMKLRGTDMGEKGVITEIKENGKLKVTLPGVKLPKETLKMQNISNFENSEEYNVGDKVIHKKTGREGKILEKEIGNIKVELEAVEEEGKVLQALDADFFKPLSAPSIETSPNPQEKEVTKTVVTETTTTTTTVTSSQEEKVEKVEKVKGNPSENAMAFVVCFVSVLAILLFKKYFGEI